MGEQANKLLYAIEASDPLSMIEAGMLAKIDNAGLINLANHVQVHYNDLSRIIKLGTDKLVVVREF